MATSSRRVLVVETEKSPKVQQSNQIEAVMLYKDKQMLKRSRGAVVNRITVDQKILYRRFLRRKKKAQLSYARISGNRELERELRGEEAVTLNTEVDRTLGGSSRTTDKDGKREDQILEKIWAVGRNKAIKYLGKNYEKFDTDPAPISGTIKVGISLNKPRDVDGETGSNSGDCPQSARRLASVGLITQLKGRRPATSHPSSTAQAATDADETTSSAVEARRPKTCFTGRRPMLSAGSSLPKSNVAWDKSDDELEQSKHQTQKLNRSKNKNHATLRAKSAIDKRVRNPQTEDEPLLPEELAKFQAAVKLERRNKLQAEIDQHESRVQDFVETLRPLTATSNVVDYYATKLQQCARLRAYRAEWQIPSTPPEVVGHGASARSLTLREVDTNFDCRPSTYIDLSAL